MALVKMESGGAVDELEVGAEAQMEAGKRKVQRWTAEEHNRLEELVRAAWPNIKWPQIASALNTGRTGKQCRERHLNARPENKKGSWTYEEEKLIAKLHSEMGPAWSKISKRLTARTENDTKNHWNALLRCKTLDSRTDSLLGVYARLIRDGSPACPATYDEAMRHYNMHGSGCSSPQTATASASPPASSSPVNEPTFDELLHVCVRLAQEPNQPAGMQDLASAPQLLQPSPQLCGYPMPPPVRVSASGRGYHDANSSASTTPPVQLPASSGSERSTLCESLEFALHKTRHTAMLRITNAMPAPTAYPAPPTPPSMPVPMPMSGIPSIATSHGLELVTGYSGSQPNSALSSISYVTNHASPFDGTPHQVYNGSASPMDLPTLVMEAPLPPSNMGMLHGSGAMAPASSLQLGEQLSNVPGWGCDANMMQDLEQSFATNQGPRRPAVKRSFSALEDVNAMRLHKAVRRHASCLPGFDGASSSFLVDGNLHAQPAPMMRRMAAPEPYERTSMLMAAPPARMDAVHGSQRLHTQESSGLLRHTSGSYMSQSSMPSASCVPPRFAALSRQVPRCETPGDLQQMYNDLVGGQMDLAPPEHTTSMFSQQTQLLSQQGMPHMQSNGHMAFQRMSTF